MCFYKHAYKYIVWEVLNDQNWDIDLLVNEQ